MSSSVHLDLDGAWPDSKLSTRDLRSWGPRLRFTSPARLIEEFYREVSPNLENFILFGSGDFHHLSALWLRRFKDPLTLISFDNHPDWDWRPPRWACGGWINRALAKENIRKASIWGCGNFELKWPHRIFGNRAAVLDGRLEIFAWQEQFGIDGSGLWNPISRSDWKERFTAFAGNLSNSDVYVTIDMDCLAEGEAVTQWEQGRFSAQDVAWALETLRASARIVGGDLCGAWSEPRYARWTQKFASGFDHPRIAPVNLPKACELNSKVFRTIWPALTGGSS